MIVSNKDALDRLESPMNLINRLNSGVRRRDAMGLFGIGNGNGKPAIPTTSLVEGNRESDKLEIPEVSFNPFQKSTALVPQTSNPPVPSKPTLPPSSGAEAPNLDNLLGNADSQIKLSLAHDKALGVLDQALDELKIKVSEIKPDKLPGVIAATSKVVDQIQRQRIDANKARGNREVHFHFYTPERKKVEDYEVVEVG